ncbi:ATP-binding protein [Leifsonia sp. NPDC056665]|uniref:ATP-binding protein n=1 Tax=Leifsonia sp. NPDC056665 TaxID=3345901 RepID=UPI0036B33C0D
MSTAESSLLNRRALRVALRRLAEDPVVLLEGPRSVGKSTALRELATTAGSTILDLDDLATRDAISSDPALFLTGEPPVCIDEYQKVPAILDAIKAELNRATSPGRFLLAGSTRYEALPQAAQSLTGRLDRVAIQPFTQTEIDGTENIFVEQLFGHPESLITSASSSTSRDDYIQRIVRGGFPLAIERPTPASRSRWFESYVRLTLERDAQELGKLRQATVLPRLLARLAGQTAQVLSLTDAGADIGLSAPSVESYTRILEAVFLVHLLPAWGTTLTARTSNRPKIHVVDSGVAAHLLRLSADRLARRDATALTEFGHLLETFVVGEVGRQTSWMDGIAGTGHWRTYDGDEVDFVAELHDGSVVAIEVKAGRRVAGTDLNPLRRLRDRLGDRFVAGVALYLGERSYSYEDRLHVIPVDKLWLSY